MACLPCFYMSIHFLFLYLSCQPIDTHILSRSVKPLCLEDEMSALLQFKEDCCSWDGIECDENTGHVIVLDLGSSFLYGSIDNNSTIFQLAHLEKLNLGDNHFNYSRIPSRVGDLSRLTHLNLSASFFSGQVPSEIFKLTRLVYLNLCCNLDPHHDRLLLEMKAPGLRRLSQNLTGLEELLLGFVNMSSQVPNTLANLSSLRRLNMDECDLHGIFPPAIFHLPKLQYLSVDDNEDLTGRLPNFNSSSPLKELRLGGTSFYGELPASIVIYKGLKQYYSKVLDVFTVIDLSNNSFEGEIPDAIGDLQGLHGLSLSNNFLTGHIPSSFGNLTVLESLDLSRNKLSGRIPQKLTELTFLSSLNVSYNNLTGFVPRGAQFDTFTNNSFEGNSGLCGEFIPKKCRHLGYALGQPPTQYEEDLGLPIELDWKIVRWGMGVA
ncbi:receptor-like protein 7 [Eucalyptus grandis]|uniref:receptor-like protein 7 n=1 Tax=Eucalyptus grandis TaxID=71139 RepID=UPI00192EEE5F|nr:receptor-like protein 7 [Eucalyptus grandis]